MQFCTQVSWVQRKKGVEFLCLIPHHLHHYWRHYFSRKTPVPGRGRCQSWKDKVCHFSWLWRRGSRTVPLLHCNCCLLTGEGRPALGLCYWTGEPQRGPSTARCPRVGTSIAWVLIVAFHCFQSMEEGKLNCGTSLLTYCLCWRPCWVLPGGRSGGECPFLG